MSKAQTSTVQGAADPELAKYLEQLRDEPGLSCRELGAEALRESSRQRSSARPRGAEMTSVRELIVPGDVPISVRLYEPRIGVPALVVFFHGGGWVFGSLDSHDGICRDLAQGADVAVLAVDYRRAPEHPWPAAVDDAVTVTIWAMVHAMELAGTDVVAVAGDSSGGNLAALACLRLRDEGDLLPAGQVLICPNTDLTLGQPSVVEKSTGWGLDADDVKWFTEQWVPDPSLRVHPRVSPLHEPDLSCLPPAIIVTAEHDPLRDEGDEFSSRLRVAGVAVQARCESGLVHGFLGLVAVSPTAAAAASRLHEDVRDFIAHLS